MNQEMLFATMKMEEITCDLAFHMAAFFYMLDWLSV